MQVDAMKRGSYVDTKAVNDWVRQTIASLMGGLDSADLQTTAALYFFAYVFRLSDADKAGWLESASVIIDDVSLEQAKELALSAQPFAIALRQLTLSVRKMEPEPEAKA
jgi:hypothetical protein